MPRFYHYSDRAGWNGIRSQVVWQFKAVQPKSSERPFGAYFTDIDPKPENHRTMFKRLRLPKIKQEYVFEFTGNDGLSQLFEGRGRDQRIFYSSVDYEVIEIRQKYEGPTKFYEESP